MNARLHKLHCFLSLCLLVALGGAASADQPKEDSKKEPARPKIAWIDGPATARLGEIAEIKVPSGFRFTGNDGTHTFLEMTGNPPSGDELGTIVPAEKSDDAESWFVIFEFEDTGYVRDDDRNQLDPDALMKSIKDNTEEANKERARRGWLAYHVRKWNK